MGFFDTGLPERPHGKRTQRPRPVTWFNQATQREEVRETAGYYWEEIGLRTDVIERQGMLPTGNNLYSILQRDILTRDVTLQMLGYLREPPPNFPKTSRYLQGYLNLDPEEDAPIWFSRAIDRGTALDTLEPLARGGDYHLFLRELSRLTGYNIIQVETLRVIPRTDEGYYG